MSDFLDAIMNAGEVYEKYGVKGCVITLLILAAVIAGIIALAYALG